MLSSKTSWLRESFPNKFEKRWMEVYRCEQLRETAREHIPARQKTLREDPRRPWIPQDKIKSAQVYYSMSVGVEKRCIHVPYNRNLVYEKRDQVTPMYYPACWVRTLYDKQWWIVAERVAPVGIHRDLSYLYSFFLMFLPPTYAPLNVWSTNPTPCIWISLDYHGDFQYPNEATIKPPSTHASTHDAQWWPQLRVKTWIKEKRGETYVKRIWHISTNIGGRENVTTIVQYHYQGGWPIETDAFNSENIRFDKSKMRNAIDFLRAIDKEHRSNPEKPIVIEKNGAPVSINATRKHSTECAGPFLAALSVLRTCKFGKRDAFTTPQMRTPASRQRHTLESVYKMKSPLQYKFDYGTGKNDKVLQEVKKLLDQCAFILGDTNKARYALWLTYSMVAEESGAKLSGSYEYLKKTGPLSLAPDSTSIKSNQAVRSAFKESQFGLGSSDVGIRRPHSPVPDSSSRNAKNTNPDSNHVNASQTKRSTNVRRTIQPKTSVRDYPSSSTGDNSRPSSRTSSTMLQDSHEMIRQGDVGRRQVADARTQRSSLPSVKSQRASVQSSPTSTRRTEGAQLVSGQARTRIDVMARSPLSIVRRKNKASDWS